MEDTNRLDIPKKLFLFIFYFFSMYILSTIVSIIIYFILLKLYPNNPNNNQFTLTLTMLITYAVMSFVFLFVLRKYYDRQLREFRNKLLYFIGLAIAFWVFNIILTIIINQIIEALDFTLRESENQKAVVESFKYPLLSIPMVIFGAPIVEETIFRGVIFNFARNLKLPYKLNIVLAFFLSSTLFGMIHVFSAYIMSGDETELILGITYASAGFMLTLLYYITNNIFVPMLMHFIQNSFSVIIILLLPYLPTEPPMKIVYLLEHFINIT